jgi:hypothetical protein
MWNHHGRLELEFSGKDWMILTVQLNGITPRIKGSQRLYYSLDLTCLEQDPDSNRAEVCKSSEGQGGTTSRLDLKKQDRIDHLLEPLPRLLLMYSNDLL